jgi:hypothetical protein
MENNKPWWEIQCFPVGTPKQIAWRGFKIFLVAYIVSSVLGGLKVNIFGATFDAVLIKIFVIVSGYGSLLTLIGLLKYLAIKWKKNEK